MLTNLPWLAPGSEITLSDHVGLENHCGGLSDPDIFPGSTLRLHLAPSLFKNFLITGLGLFTVFQFVVATVDVIVTWCASHKKNQDPVCHYILQAEKKRSWSNLSLATLQALATATAACKRAWGSMIELMYLASSSKCFLDILWLH